MQEKINLYVHSLFVMVFLKIYQAMLENVEPITSTTKMEQSSSLLMVKTAAK